MNIFYLLNQRFPTEKGYGLQVARMCDAFLKNNINVELLVPKRGNHISDDPYSYYDMNSCVTIRTVKSPDFYFFGIFDVVSVFIKNLISAFNLVREIKNKTGIIYSRDEIVIYIASFYGIKGILELHRFSSKRNFYYRRFKKMGIKIVAISQNLKNDLIKNGFNEKNILVAHDGVDVSRFVIGNKRDELKKKLNLPVDKKIVMYTGHLYKWKGVDVLIDSSEYINGEFVIVIVGGTPGDIENYQKIKTKNVIFVGHQPYSLMPEYLNCADVLVIPNSAEEDISRLYTSPLKLFTYMASNRPIVASDLPSLREILNEGNSILVTPDSPKSLAEGINRLLNDYSLGIKLSENAFDDVQEYEWENRVKKILSFMG